MFCIVFILILNYKKSTKQSLNARDVSAFIQLTLINVNIKITIINIKISAIKV